MTAGIKRKGIFCGAFCRGCLEDLFRMEGGRGIMPGPDCRLIIDPNDGHDERIATIREIRDLLSDSPMWRVRAWEPPTEKRIRGLV